MGKIKCYWYTVLYTLKWGIARREIIFGHHYTYTGEVHIDHWHMKCINCGQEGASDVGPQAEGEILE